MFVPKSHQKIKFQSQYFASNIVQKVLELNQEHTDCKLELKWTAFILQLIDHSDT